MSTIRSLSSSTAASATTFDPSKAASRLATKVFSDMDADTDGSVTKDEFVKGLESKGVSSEDATKQYQAIDKEGTGSITKSDLESAIKSGDFKPQRPQSGGEGGTQGARGAGGAGGTSATVSSSTKTYEAADKNEDGTVTEQEQLVYDRAQAAKSGASTTSTTSADKLGNNVDAMA
ncbi:EF-hand domain-containing protein [Duganella sp. FT50W]|uniref:EF-hand domain-containing protein n=1 Tax=Duganella lactea TaxID=2692173 RepID=A0A6L8MQG4_9BURK|nr:EF-hand domain-containing protein [Duganella lactea]MYM82588.1 EF-hand domain-containing protein [Duganella lactea]